MYVQLVTYSLGMSENEYLDVAHELAPAFSRMSGLQAKVWLEDPDIGRYGALYLWEDRESMERFLRSDLFEGTNPEFVDVDSEGFTILENLTAQTQPGVELVESRRAAPVKRSPTAIAEKASAPAKKTTTGGARKLPVSAKAAAPATKAATGKAATGKAATGKAATGKAATGKAVTGKAATGKAATKKAPAKKAPAKKAPAKKAPAKKGATTNAVAKKAPARKASKKSTG